MKTCRVQFCGQMVRAFADASGVFCWDSVAGHYVRPTTLTPAQERYVRSRAMN